MTMAVVKNGATRSGFGPADLLDGLRRAKWKPCIPKGRNFDGMTLGGYCLTDTPDELCSTRYLVTIRNEEMGETFSVGGYAFPDLLASFAAGREKTNFTPAHIVLVKKPTSKKRVQFTVTVTLAPDPTHN